MLNPEHEPERTKCFRDSREKMVRRDLRSNGIKDARVLDAMGNIPREEFVLDQLRDDAYANRALPIDCGQTISQPYTVARMCEAAAIGENDKVLEVGTGSGYGAAVLSRLCSFVHTVERLKYLAQQASTRFRKLGIANVEVHIADDTLGLVGEAPFDAIVVTASAPELPHTLAEQLAEGGRMIIPIGPADRQHLYRFTRRESGLKEENLGAYVFVPLIGNDAWPAKPRDV